VLGHDTEFFLFDKVLGRAVPAHSHGIPKDKRTTHSDWSAHGSYFRDGYAVEINSSPGKCSAKFWTDIHHVLKEAAEIHLPPHVTYISDPIVPVNLKEDIIKGPEDVKRLGCNPTYDPYRREIKEITIDPLTLPFRTSGAHLHLSLSSPNSNIPLSGCANLAKLADLLLGLPFTIIFGDDKEFQRRELYGQAGEFRPQNYGGSPGFEYRVLSSRLYNHPAIYGLFLAIWKYVFSYKANEIITGVLPTNPALDNALQKAINLGQGGEALLEEFSSFLKKNPLPRDSAGMGGVAYIPKDWGAAILKLKAKRLAGDFDELGVLTHTDGHWGWYEANTGKINGSTIGKTSGVKKEAPWKL